MILVSLARAFRRRQPGPDSAATQIRGQFMAQVAIAFTLASDLIALIRHQPLWIASSAGRELFALTACFLLAPLAAIVLLLATTQRPALPPLRASFLRTVAFPAAALLVLACYPERLRQTLAGEIFTVLCGIALLFVVVWAIGSAFVPAAPHIPARLAAIGDKTDGEPARSIAVRIASWLLPVSRRWSIVVAVGLLCGAFLVFQELSDGGSSPHGSKRLLVIAVYLSLETAGVVTGYAFLAEQLALFPRGRTKLSS